MKHYGKFIVPAVLALGASMSGCGKQAAAPAPQAAPVIEAYAPPKNTNATVLGAIKKSDWYMVVSAPGSAKPLVIWSESKSVCERDVGEFSLKAVHPASKAEPPKSWCMQGKEIQSKLGV
ncbi:hypothetical protein ACFPOU_08295 [Massilia jejuensis]|uniref:Common-antigen outer membrane protein n=1 Tax=Massilia jejuensis TaxID=648894 RepID=A0ABW0PEP9_9BURK